jgi:hypothetical protein
VATVSNPTHATLEEAVALLGALATEKRLLELRIQDLEHRLYGSSSEKLPIEDRQLAKVWYFTPTNAAKANPLILLRSNSSNICSLFAAGTRIRPAKPSFSRDTLTFVSMPPTYPDQRTPR